MAPERERPLPPPFSPVAASMATGENKSIRVLWSRFQNYSRVHFGRLITRLKSDSATWHGRWSRCLHREENVKANYTKLTDFGLCYVQFVFDAVADVVLKTNLRDCGLFWCTIIILLRVYMWPYPCDCSFFIRFKLKIFCIN